MAIPVFVDFYRDGQMIQRILASFTETEKEAGILLTTQDYDLKINDVLKYAGREIVVKKALKSEPKKFNSIEL